MTKTVTIPLDSAKYPGLSVLIDEADLDLVAGHTWSAVRDGQTFYAVRTVQLSPRPSRRTTTIRMHRVILGAKRGQIVDHIDGNGLNNTRANLRLVSSAQNAMNRRRRTHSRSGFKGVTFDRNERLLRHWKATVTIEGKNRHLGYFDTAEEAARAYDDAVREHFGAHARVNFPRDGEAGV